MNKTLSFFLFLGFGVLLTQTPLLWHSSREESNLYSIASKCDNSISGVIKNKLTQKAIFEVTVELWSPDEHLATVLTDYKGEFTFGNVVCDQAYDIVSYKEGYYGFAEVHTTPERTQQLFLYLNPEAPEEYDEEIEASNEMTVINTETNQIIKENLIASTSTNNEFIPNLTFAEKRELARVEKKRNNKVRVATELEKERKSGITKKYGTKLSFAEKRELARLEKVKYKKEHINDYVYDPLDDTRGKSYYPKREKKDNLSFAQKRDQAKKQKEAAIKEKIRKEKEEKRKKEEEFRLASIAKSEKARLQSDKERKVLYEQAIATAKKLKLEKEFSKIAEEKKKIEQLAILKRERIKEAEEKQKAIKALRQKQLLIQKEAKEKLIAERKEEERLELEKREKAMAYAESVKLQQEEKQKAALQKIEDEIVRNEEARIANIKAKEIAEKEKVDALQLTNKKAEDALITERKEEERLETEKREKAMAYAKSIRLQQEQKQKEALQKIEDEITKNEEARIANIKAKEVAEKEIADAFQLTEKKVEDALIAERKEEERLETEKREKAMAYAKNLRLQQEKEQKEALQRIEDEIVRNEEARIADIKAKEVAEKEITDAFQLTEKKANEALVAERKEEERLEIGKREKAMAYAKSVRLQQEEKQKAVLQRIEDEIVRNEEARIADIKAKEIAEKEKVDALQLTEKKAEDALIAERKEEERLETKKREKAMAYAESVRLQQEKEQKEALQKIEDEIVRNEEVRIADIKAKEIAEKEKVDALQLTNKKAEDALIAERKEEERLEIEKREKAMAYAESVRLQQEENEAIARKEVEKENITVEHTFNNNLKKETNNLALQDDISNQSNINKEQKNALEKEFIKAKAEKEYALRAVQQKDAAIIVARTYYTKKLLRREKEIAIAKAETIQKRINQLSKELSIENNEEYSTDIVENVKENPTISSQEFSDNQIDKIEDLKEEPLVSDKPVSQRLEKRCSQTISGAIQSSFNLDPITGANIDMYYEGQNIESAQTNANGEFFFYNVDCNTDYTLICFKKSYNNIAKAEINTTSLPNQIILLLEPDEEISNQTEKIEIQNIPIITESEEKIEPVNVNQVESNEETNLVESNKEFSKEISTVTEEEKITNIQPNNTNSEIAINKPDYIPDLASPEVKGKKIQIDPIYFELDEWYLTLPSRRELDKIIVLMYQNPTMIIESGSHTDSRGGFNYNLTLSEKRSQEAVGYLIANGVDPDRISGRGYGETMTVNKCVDGVRCTDREHLQNRRTEFVILKQ